MENTHVRFLFTRCTLTREFSDTPRLLKKYRTRVFHGHNH